MKNSRKESNPNLSFLLDAIEDNEKCVDEEKDCESYKNFCDVYPKQMKQICRKSCGFCTTGKYTFMKIHKAIWTTHSSRFPT